ncbi:4'-phosphopantetheinyl transferase family protein [Sinomicrobium sp. M5D2P9]
MKVWFHLLDKDNLKEYLDIPVENPYFKARTDAFRFDPDKAKRVAAYLLLKKAILHSGNPPELMNRMKHTTYGKPYIEDWDTFNFTYSRQCVALFLGRTEPVGLDIEFTEDMDTDILSWPLHPGEKDYIIKADNQKQAFYEIWTRKEAVLKAAASGITDTMKKLDCSGNPARFRNKIWFLKKLSITSDYVCHAATGTNTSEIKTISIPKEILLTT